MRERQPRAYKVWVQSAVSTVSAATFRRGGARRSIGCLTKATRTVSRRYRAGDPRPCGRTSLPLLAAGRAGTSAIGVQVPEWARGVREGSADQHLATSRALERTAESRLSRQRVAPNEQAASRCSPSLGADLPAVSQKPGGNHLSTQLTCETSPLLLVFPSF